MRNTLLLCAAGLLLAGSAAAQKDQYLDVMVVKVKPEKRAQFDALVKRVADANRRNNGDIWLAMSTEYGEQNTVTFSSRRASYADIDRAGDAFRAALSKAFGRDGAGKMFADFNSCILSSTGEIRRRRWDLSLNAPLSSEDDVKFLGNARWIRSSAVQVKPGRTLDYETQISKLKEQSEKGGMKLPVFVSQSVAGPGGTTFYMSTFGQSLGSFDEFPMMRNIIGEENYRSYMTAVSDLVVSSTTSIMRVLPELSCVSKEVAAVAPAFWNPAPPPAAKPKPKPPEGVKAQ
jgi:hypothetical protein